MNSIFGDLDQLIEQAVAKATNTEKSLQKKQEKEIKKQKLQAKKADESSEVEEADDEKSDDDESAEKIKGKGPEEKGEKDSSGKKKGDETPGTPTSKKLSDPPEKVIFDPKFDDIQNKINTLRGSGSLKDEKVSSAVKAYLGSLKPAERGALLTYLTNLSQIMTSVKSPSDVKDPEKQGIKIMFKKKTDTEKQSTVTATDKEKDSSVIFVGDK